MPKYRVTLNEDVSYTIEVDAENEDAAGIAAEEAFVQADDFKDMGVVVNSRDVEHVEIVP